MLLGSAKIDYDKKDFQYNLSLSMFFGLQSWQCANGKHKEQNQAIA
jgi:hypothetical protein